MSKPNVQLVEDICHRPIRVFLRTPYNYDTNEASKLSGLKCLDPSRAQQNQKLESDINEIVRRFGLTGKLPDNPRVPQYGDFSVVNDYQTALNAVISAQQAFGEFPAHIRSRFNNDPQELLEFVADDRNREEAERLGLIPKKALNEPTASAGVPPSGAAGKTPQAKGDKTGE